MISYRCWLGLWLGSIVWLGAGDWPQWRGPARDGQVAADAKLVRSFAAEPKVVWKLKAGEGLASPVVAGGRAFLFDSQDGKETLRVVRVADASELWRAAIDEPFKDSQGPVGPRCSPVVDGDRVYVQSCRGELQCLDVADGKRLWSVNFTKDFGATFIGEKGNAPGATRHGNNGSPLADGDRLFVQVGSTNGAGLVCFDKMSGRVLWRSQNDVAGYAAPVLATLAGVRQLVSFTADGVIGLRRDDGRLLWRFPIKTAFARHATTPVIHGDMVIVSSHQVGLLGLKVSPEGAGQKVEQAWVNKEAAMNFASPVNVNAQLVGLGPRKDLVAVDIPTGRLLWKQEGWWTTSADKAYGGFLVLGKNVLTLTDSGTLILFAPELKGAREISRAQVTGLNWCNPAYVDGKLFLRDGFRQNGDWICLELD